MLRACRSLDQGIRGCEIGRFVASLGPSTIDAENKGLTPPRQTLLVLERARAVRPSSLAAFAWNGSLPKIAAIGVAAWSVDSGGSMSSVLKEFRDFLMNGRDSVRRDRGGRVLLHRQAGADDVGAEDDPRRRGRGPERRGAPAPGVDRRGPRFKGLTIRSDPFWALDQPRFRRHRLRSRNRERANRARA
jgi:hypothetical protein